MNWITFDTLQASQELENVGIPKDQARAISLIIRKSHEANDIATKTNITEINRNIKNLSKNFTNETNNISKDIKITKKDLQLKISHIRAEQKLIKWILYLETFGIFSILIKIFFSS